MNVGPDSVELLSTRMPPNHSTITIMTVPRNSLMGWASCCRLFTLITLLRCRSLTSAKRSFIFSSAQKALMMRSPPSVSSTWLIVSLHSACASLEFCFSLRPTLPITQPMSGTMASVNSVSCQLMKMSVEKYAMMRIGFLKSMSSDDMMELSTSLTSPVMRAMMSPLRSPEKNPSGSDVIFL